MREIEFRIRYGDKTWYYGVPLTKIKNDTVAFQSFDGNYYDLFADATTLGQYTGLKDKNGTMIFEGDIVKYEDYDGYPSYDVFTNAGIIEYAGNAFWVSERNRVGMEDLVDEFTNTMECEIIGNIHDNPELIGGSDEIESN